MKNCQVGESAIYSVFVYAHNPNFTQGGIYTYGYKPKSRYKLSVFDFMVVRQTIPRFFIQKILLILVQINCILLRLLMSYNLNSHNLKGIYLFVAMLSLLINTYSINTQNVKLQIPVSINAFKHLNI